MLEGRGSRIAIAALLLLGPALYMVSREARVYHGDVGLGRDGTWTVTWAGARVAAPGGGDDLAR